VHVEACSERWDFGEARHEPAEHLGRRCMRLSTHEGAPLVTVRDLTLEDGTFEVELAVPPRRSFPGVAWRILDEESFESFFVRPHQNGNPDAIQYTPVFNGMSSWQLYHGEGFWNAVELPVGAWFTIRVAFAGAAAEVSIDGGPVLGCALRRSPAAGRIGVQVGAEELWVAGLEYAETRPRVSAPAPVEPTPGAVRTWLVSDPFPASALDPVRLDLGGRTWARFEAEPDGLLDLARANPRRGDRDTVFARAVIRSEHAGVRALELGFSDRALVYLGGRALFRGDDAYRSRDYRFLGSIGWYDTLYVPLEAGDNELVVAVSEDFGGWGVQARFPEASGLAF